MIRVCPACFLLFSLVSGVDGQTLERVKDESTRLRQTTLPTDPTRDREILSGLHSALRDWIEAQLPQSRTDLDARLPFITAKINADLERDGLNRDDKPGSVKAVEFSRPPEDADKLVVKVGLPLQCGNDNALYVYGYGQGSPSGVLHSNGSDVRFSKRDAVGNQLILTLSSGPQCEGTWSSLAYVLFRLSANSSTTEAILTGDHEIWFGADNPYQVRLEPDDLLMELRDRSIDAGIHNRAHVLHYDPTQSSVNRIDPVAVKPEDFVDEWLTRPWEEMESRSAEGKPKLKMWHEFLSGDLVAGDFTLVQACKENPNQWQIGVALDWIKGKELPEPFSVYFLVRQSEQYRFKMIAIDFDRQDGCPGESPPTQGQPSLFPTETKIR